LVKSKIAIIMIGITANVTNASFGLSQSMIAMVLTSMKMSVRTLSRPLDSRSFKTSTSLISRETVTPIGWRWK
jgi:hypothetical protein